MGEVRLRVLVRTVTDEIAGTRIDFINPHTNEITHRLLVPPKRQVPLELVVKTEDEEPARTAAVSRQIRKMSKKQERRIANDVGGRMQPASGALPYAKGDVRKQGKLRIEAKSTYAESYRLTEDVLDKIAAHASYEEIPVVVVDFVDKKDNKVKRSVAVVPYEDWLRTVNDASDVDQ